MSLLDYQEAVPWANAMKLQVLDLKMPPWLPVEGVSDFRHARTLSAEEVDILVDWAVGQTPEGEPLTAEERAAQPETGSAPPPDLVLAPEPGEAVVVAEDEYEKRLCLVLDTGLDEPRVATAFHVMPDKPGVLRRATIHLGASCEEGKPLATWLPDRSRVGFAAGSGVRLDADARLAVELYYVKGWNDEGKRLSARPRLGMSFGDDATPVATHPVDGTSYRLPDAATLVALYPSSGAAEGEEPLRVEARLPDGSARSLLVIERFDPAWREKYLLESPLSLPAGTEIRVTQPTVWIDFLPAVASAGE